MSEDNKKMKLFIWPEIACDYTCGMAAALAPDLESAITVIATIDDHTINRYVIKELRSCAYLVIELDTDQIQGWYTLGGS